MIIILFYAKNYRKDIPIIFKLSIYGLILFLTQGLFGGLTVIAELNEFIVVGHLANAILIIMMEMLLAFYATIHSKGFSVLE